MNHDGMRKHEDHEDLECEPGRMRKDSPLSGEEEWMMRRTIGCALSGHRALGPGFLESIYRKAMCLELEARNLAYEKECSIRVSYRGVDIPGQRVDLIVEGQIVVELKAVSHLDSVHKAQLISYLKTTGLRGGLLINFRVPILKDGIRRVVL